MQSILLVHIRFFGVIYLRPHRVFIGHIITVSRENSLFVPSGRPLDFTVKAFMTNPISFKDLL
jgi:hypothetical protein